MSGIQLLRWGPALAAAALAASCAVAPLPAPEPRITESTEPSLPLDRRPPPVARPRPVDVASWYGEWHHGRPTASGEPYDMDALTAAHRSLPLGACVEVTHLGNGRRVFVRVNDRGPYVAGRTIDLSQRAAIELGMLERGVARVRITKAKPETCES
jgi:rare lipoprotein A